MTRVEGEELMVSGGLLYYDMKLDPAPNTPIPGSDGGNAGGAGPILGVFYTPDLSDDWDLGLSLHDSQE